MINSAGAGDEGKVEAATAVGQLLTSLRHLAAIRYSQLTEVPFLYVHVIKNTVSTTVNHLDVHYKQPIAHALFSMPSGILHRIFGRQESSQVNEDDEYDIEAGANSSSLTLSAENSFKDGQHNMELVYENWTLDDVLHERFTRTKYDFTPPHTWSFPFSVSVAVLRAIMQNNVSLNAIRSLADINYNFYPPAYRVYYFPSDPTEFDSLWFTHGITPIYRLDNVVPPGFDFDTKFKFPAPNSPRKHGQLTIKRFSVHVDQEGHPDVLGGEYMTSDRIIGMRKSIMTSMFGCETVQAAERLCKALKNAASCRWYTDIQFMELMRSYRGRGLREEPSVCPSTNLNDNGKSTAMIQYMSKPKRELLQSWKTYLMFFERFNADLSYEKIKKCSRSNEKVILYLHGGGYCLMSAASHRGLAWQISAQTDCLIVGINYRRTPEHHFPAALVDATSAYLQLIFPQMPSRHSFDIFDFLNMNVFHPAVISGTAPLLPVSPDRVIIMGDSAGGGLVMSLLLHIKESGYPLPGGAVLLSPWLDLTCSLPSWNKNDQYDYLPRMDGRQYENIMSAFTSWRDDLLVHPLVSPLFGDVNDLCPILIQIGEREYLLDDSLMMAEKMKGRHATKSNIFRLEVFQDMIHVWHFFELPLMSRVAFDKIGEFTRRIISDSWISLGEQVSKSNNVEEDSLYECITVAENRDEIKEGQHTEIVYISNDGQEHSVEGPLKLGGDFKFKPVFEMK